MRPHLALPSLAVLFAAASAASAQTEETEKVDLEVRYWMAEPSGEVQVVDGGFGTVIDLESDLGLEDDDAIEGRLTLRPSRRTKILLAWVSLSFAGDEVLSRTIEFGGETFTLSTRVASLLDFEYGRAGFAWQFLSSHDGRFRLGPLIEVKGFRGEAEISAPDLPIVLAAREEFEAAFGAVGLTLDLEPSDRVQVFADWTMVVEADEGDATDLEAGVRVRLTDLLAISGGYRTFQIDAEEDDDTFDLDIEGAFVGLLLRF